MILANRSTADNCDDGKTERQLGAHHESRHPMTTPFRENLSRGIEPRNTRNTRKSSGRKPFQGRRCCRCRSGSMAVGEPVETDRDISSSIGIPFPQVTPMRGVRIHTVENLRHDMLYALERRGYLFPPLFFFRTTHVLNLRTLRKCPMASRPLYLAVVVGASPGSRPQVAHPGSDRSHRANPFRLGLPRWRFSQRSPVFCPVRDSRQ